MRATLVVDRRCRYAGFDELDPSAVDDEVVRRGCNRYSPPEVMGDAEPHPSIVPRSSSRDVAG